MLERYFLAGDLLVGVGYGRPFCLAPHFPGTLLTG